MASDCIVVCGCRRKFRSNAALEQHRRDKAGSGSAAIVLNRCANIQVSRVPDSVPIKPPKGPEIRHSKDQWLAKGAGNVVDTLTSTSLKLSSSERSISNNYHYDLICSYNWLHKKTPEVYVPGGAPVFEGISLPMTIEPDSCRHFIDQKDIKMPLYPFEVVFQAAEMMNPTVRFDEIDVLTNRNSLLKFFDFCEGHVKKSFRVNLHLVNDTLIIERYVRSTAEYFPGSSTSGFGHNFEKAATRLPRGLENSSGHLRALRYDFGDLKCAVCFEADASYDSSDPVGESERHDPEAESHGKEIASPKSPLSWIAVDEPGSGSTGSSADTIPRGAGTDQASVAELKSRGDHSSDPKPCWLPQLWLGRTRYLITGHHENGTFDDVRVDDLREELEAWEKNEINQATLQKVAILLSRLRDTVRASKVKSCVAFCEKSVRPYTLRIHASTSERGPLPAPVVEKFWNKRTN